MFLRHGSNNIQKTPKTHKKRKIHVQALPCTNWFHLVPNWFLRGSYLVPTVFDSSDSCSYKLKSHQLVLMHMQCSKIVERWWVQDVKCCCPNLSLTFKIQEVNSLHSIGCRQRPKTRNGLKKGDLGKMIFLKTFERICALR